MIRRFLKKHKIHPRKWWLGLISYSRFIGYIRPALSKGTRVDYRIWRKLMTNAWEPRELTVPIGKRILVISPHSDDEAIGAGGILYAHRDLSEIHIVLLTDGSAYGFTQAGSTDACSGIDQLVATRKQELLKTAAALNANTVTFLDLPDGKLTADEAAVLRLQEVLETVRPDVVILPWFLDGHPDHQAANLLFAKANRHPGLLVLGYEIWAVLDPNAYFDITGLLEAKLRLIENYPSQLREVDYQGFAQSLARVRGYQMIQKSANRAAEAFVALPSEDYCALVNEVL